MYAMCRSQGKVPTLCTPISWINDHTHSVCSFTKLCKQLQPQTVLSFTKFQHFQISYLVAQATLLQISFVDA